LTRRERDFSIDMHRDRELWVSATLEAAAKSAAAFVVDHATTAAIVATCPKSPPADA